MKRYIILLSFLIAFSTHSQKLTHLSLGAAWSGFSKDVASKYYYRCPELLFHFGIKHIYGNTENIKLGGDIHFGVNRTSYEWPGKGPYQIQRDYLAVNITFDYIINPEDKVKFLLGLSPSLIARQSNKLITSNQDLKDIIQNYWYQNERVTLNFKPEISFPISENRLINISSCVSLVSKFINPTYRVCVSHAWKI